MEYWDIYDEKKQKTGRTMRMGCRLVGSTGRRSQRGRRFQGRSDPRDPRGDRN